MANIPQKIKRDARGHRTDRVSTREAQRMRRLYEQENRDATEIAKALKRNVRTVKRHLSMPARTSAQVPPPQRQRPTGMLLGLDPLAKTMEHRLSVPVQGTPLLSHTPEAIKEIEDSLKEAMERGDSHDYLQLFSTSSRYSWWRSDVEPRANLNLDAHETALLRQFVKLPTSSRFREALGKWGAQGTGYLQLVLAGASAAEIDQAYQTASHAGEAAVEALWDAVERLRWE